MSTFRCMWGVRMLALVLFVGTFTTGMTAEKERDKETSSHSKWSRGERKDRRGHKKGARRARVAAKKRVMKIDAKDQIALKKAIQTFGDRKKAVKARITAARTIVALTDKYKDNRAFMAKARHDAMFARVHLGDVRSFVELAGGESRKAEIDELKKQLLSKPQPISYPEEKSVPLALPAPPPPPIQLDEFGLRGKATIAELDDALLDAASKSSEWGKEKLVRFMKAYKAVKKDLEMQTADAEK